MKTTVRNKGAVLTLAAAALLTPSLRAQPNDDRAERTLNQRGEERYVMVTGSHIPQRVTLRSIGTDTPYNLRVYSRRELESTGRQTPGEALAVLDPSITLSGRH